MTRQTPEAETEPSSLRFESRHLFLYYPLTTATLLPRSISTFSCVKITLFKITQRLLYLFFLLFSILLLATYLNSLAVYLNFICWYSYSSFIFRINKNRNIPSYTYITSEIFLFIKRILYYILFKVFNLFSCKFCLNCCC